MRVLILSAPFGSGHLRAAEATAAAVSALGAEVAIQDAFALASPRLAGLAAEAWSGLLRLAPQLYSAVYRWTEPAPSPAMHPAGNAWLLEQCLTPALARRLERVPPDVVVATHPGALAAAAHLKGRTDHPFRLISVATDFTVHGFSVLPQVDAYCLPHASLLPDLCRRGVPVSALFVTGIPVAPEFEHRLGRTAARRELGLPRDRFICTVMGGGQGLGPVPAAVQALSRLRLKPLLLALTGRNQNLAQSLMRLDVPSLQVVPHTDRPDVYLEAADLVVTKPGGLTLAEAMAKHAALALLPPLPGQEERNRQWLIRMEAAVSGELHQLGPVVERLHRSPDQLRELRRRMGSLATAGAAARVAGVVAGLAEDRHASA